ncbi:MAG TPA: lytic transglycosylase domain-containing protein [Ferruginibacter sp.]|nr:lytic transglycosylase domain-containing protein [Ferruginibacter sp.]
MRPCQYFILLFFLGIGPVHAQLKNAGSIIKEDTIKQDETAENDLIDAVVQNKSQKKDKVQYLSQLTRYGFKNLFSKYNYNPNLPYSSQVNPQAETYMQDYLRSNSGNLIKMKSWGMPYFNLIDNIFSQYGLPRELKYLAVIESNLSTGATSWVGAGGPWQFMAPTARDYGLLVNNVNDERRDYFKSTHAAARYLLSLYKQMHDWLLVIAAYNGGPGTVYSAMKKSGSKNFWNLQYYLPQESRNHVKKFIATHYIMEGASGVTPSAEFNNGFTFNTTGITGSNPYNNRPVLTPAETELSETQTISGKFHSVIIAKNLSMETSEFNRYNPQFDNLINANGQYELVLPGDKMQLFLATKYQILNECVQFMLGDSNIPNNKTVYPSKYNRPRKKS